MSRVMFELYKMVGFFLQSSVTGAPLGYLVYMLTGNYWIGAAVAAAVTVGMIIKIDDSVGRAAEIFYVPIIFWLLDSGWAMWAAPFIALIYNALVQMHGELYYLSVDDADKYIELIDDDAALEKILGDDANSLEWLNELTDFKNAVQHRTTIRRTDLIRAVYSVVCYAAAFIVSGNISWDLLWLLGIMLAPQCVQLMILELQQLNCDYEDKDDTIE